MKKQNGAPAARRKPLARDVKAPHEQTLEIDGTELKALREASVALKHSFAGLRFNRGRVQLALAVNHDRLERVYKPINEATVALLKQYAPDGEDRPAPDDKVGNAAFLSAYKEMMAEQHRVTLRTVDVAHLEMGARNQLPMETLATFYGHGVFFGELPDDEPAETEESEAEAV